MMIKQNKNSSDENDKNGTLIVMMAMRRGGRIVKKKQSCNHGIMVNGFPIRRGIIQPSRTIKHKVLENTAQIHDAFTIGPVEECQLLGTPWEWIKICRNPLLNLCLDIHSQS
jgi:hypothetical protein